MARLLTLLFVFAAAARAAAVGSVSIGYRGEPGVESKMLAGLQADITPVRFLRVGAGLSLNLFQNNGLGAAGLGVGAAFDIPGDLTIRIAAQHQQWTGWQAGENRLLVVLEAGPVHGFDAGLGVVQRVPVFGDKYWSPLVWSGGADEQNFLYRLRWKFIQRAEWWLRAGFSSYDRFTAHNPQQFPFEADGAYRLRDDLELTARASTAVVGYSGGLVSFHEFELDIGVRREF